MRYKESNWGHEKEKTVIKGQQIEERKKCTDMKANQIKTKRMRVKGAGNYTPVMQQWT